MCEDENPDDQDAKNELLELQSCGMKPGIAARPSTADPGSATVPDRRPKAFPGVETEGQRSKKRPPGPSPPRARHPADETERRKQTVVGPSRSKDPPGAADTRAHPSSVCSVCSFANGAMSSTCAMCANVLHLTGMADAWACKSQTCRGSSYRNAADCGICGVCGARKSVPSTAYVDIDDAV